MLDMRSTVKANIKKNNIYIYIYYTVSLQVSHPIMVSWVYSNWRSNSLLLYVHTWVYSVAFWCPSWDGSRLFPSYPWGALQPFAGCLWFGSAFEQATTLGFSTAAWRRYCPRDEGGSIIFDLENAGDGARSFLSSSFSQLNTRYWVGLCWLHLFEEVRSTELIAGIYRWYTARF